MLEGILIVLAVFAASAAVMAWAWVSFFPISEMPPASIELTGRDFLECLRASVPDRVDIAIIDSLDDARKCYRFRFKAIGAGPTCFETFVKTPYGWAYSEPHQRALEKLYHSASWVNYCSEHCDWCGCCMHNWCHEGWVKNPVDVIGEPDKPRIRPFIPPA